MTLFSLDFSWKKDAFNAVIAMLFVSNYMLIMLQKHAF